MLSSPSAIVRSHQTSTEPAASITGGLNRRNDANVAKRVLVAWTLFLATTVVRLRADYSHTIDAQLVHRGELVAQYSLPVKTDIVLGFTPGRSSINQKTFSEAERAHVSRLSFALAEAIEKDRAKLLQIAGSS